MSSGRAQCLTFFLDVEEYAVSLERIREILEYDSLTRVPTAPGWIRGVMNLRGNVLPVVDLRLKLDLGETSLTERSCVMIIDTEIDGELCALGLLVDDVNRVVEFSTDEIQEPPAFGTSVSAVYLEGMGKVDESFVPIINIDRVFSNGAPPASADAPSLPKASVASGDAGALGGKAGG